MPMHPYVVQCLAEDRLRERRREADRERLLRGVGAAWRWPRGLEMVALALANLWLLVWQR